MSIGKDYRLSLLKKNFRDKVKTFNCVEIYQKYIESIEEQMKNEQTLEKERERGRNRNENDEDNKRDIELRLKFIFLFFL